MKKTVNYSRQTAFWCFILIVILFHGSAFAQTNCIGTGTPTTVNGSIAAGDLTMAARPFRDGTNSTCLLNEVVGGNPIAGTFRYDVQTFTAPAGTGDVCVRVQYDNTGCGASTTFVTTYTTPFNPASVHQNILGSIGASVLNTNQSLAFKVPAGSSFDVVVSEVATTGCPGYTYTVSYSNSCQQPGFDAANDGSADLLAWRPSNATFYTATVGGALSSTQYGINGFTPTPTDWDGDGDSDFGAYSPGATSVWYTSLNPATNYGARNWGTTGDVPVQGDYDNDNISDLAVFRPSNNFWYVLRSSDSTLFSYQWGNAGDIPVPGDYDGDRRIDLAVYRPNDAANANRDTWYTLLSNRANLAFTTLAWGLAGDIRVPADYDGDGKTDVAVFRPSEGNWYIQRSGQLAASQLQVVNWGLSGDVPQPADYDGDGRADIAVFRPSTGSWYLNRSSAGFASQALGQSGDVAVTASYGVPR
jgi:FG-GAP-like repeat